MYDKTLREGECLGLYYGISLMSLDGCARETNSMDI